METNVNTLLTLTSAAAVVVAGTLAYSPASAYERSVDVVNDGSVAINSIFITSVTDVYHDRDLLGGCILLPGHQQRFELDDGYWRFDILLTFESGRELAVWGVNLWEATTISVDDYGLHVDYVWQDLEVGWFAFPSEQTRLRPELHT